MSTLVAAGSTPGPGKMFEPFQIKHLRFKNRVMRSAMGGRMAFYNGVVNESWKNFEKRFAHHGVGGIISMTMSVDEERWAPLEYPKLSHDRYVAPLRKLLPEIKAAGERSGGPCHYFMQLGDPGAGTQASLFPQAADSKSASAGFDLLFGYRTFATEMTRADIARSVQHHADAARRAREAGCDGIEVTLSKGYLSHQFLNPRVNRRRDEYGGSTENRFRFAREVMTAVRRAVGADFVVGARLSAVDDSDLPVNLRFPLGMPRRGEGAGNGLAESRYFARELEGLGVDFLHVTRGFGFPNPKENPGDFPLEEIRRFCNSIRHLSLKSRLRAALLNTVPDALLRGLMGIGWGTAELGKNADYAAEIKKEVRIPVLVNGGFQSRELIEGALAEGKCDIVTMARPLLANPHLLEVLKGGGEIAEDKLCTFCNRCTVATTIAPLGCYEPRRFASQAAMEAQILGMLDDPAGEAAGL